MAEFDLLPSPELIDRTLRVESNYTISRMQVLESLPGNPAGIAFRPVGDNAVAMLAASFPNPHFNKVVGLRGGQESEIAPLVDWYRGHSIKPRFEILPRPGDAGLCRELTRHGLSPLEFHASLIRASTPVALPPDVNVERVTTSRAMDDFLDAYTAGWRTPDPAGFKRNVKDAWFSRTGWSLFLARADGQPAAAGILFTENNVGYLADATCAPTFRGRGLHSALLAHRMFAAVTAGVDFISASAAYLSASHRNMERAGLRLQFIRTTWAEP